MSTITTFSLAAVVDWIEHATNEEVEAISLAVKRSRKRCDILGSMPSELLPKILRQLSAKDLLRVAVVSKCWYDAVVKNENIWKYHYEQSTIFSPRNGLEQSLVSWRDKFRILNKYIRSSCSQELFSEIKTNRTILDFKIFEGPDKTSVIVLVCGDAYLRLYKIRQLKSGLDFETGSGKLVSLGAFSCRSIGGSPEVLLVGGFGGEVLQLVPSEAYGLDDQDSNQFVALELWNERGTNVTSHKRIVHTSTVLCVELTENGKWIFSGSYDGTVVIWSQELQQRASNWHLNGDNQNQDSVKRIISVGENGDRVLVGSRSGISVLDLCDKAHPSCLCYKPYLWSDMSSIEPGILVSGVDGVSLLDPENLDTRRKFSADPTSYIDAGRFTMIVASGHRLNVLLYTASEKSKDVAEHTLYYLLSPISKVKFYKGCSIVMNEQRLTILKSNDKREEIFCV